jgi:D-lactate dehydrogenase (cytochrome)
VAEQAQLVQQVAREHGGEDFQWASTPEERSRLWTARHHAYLSALQMCPGAKGVTTDTCVPISHLAGMVVAAEDEARADGLPYLARTTSSAASSKTAPR